MNSRFSKYVTLTTAVAALMAPAQNAYAVCNPTLISLTVLSTALDFASMTACPAAAGQVILSQKTGARTTSGCITAVSGTTALATIRVRANQAKNNEKVEITAPISFNIAGGGNSMSVTNIRFDKGGGVQTLVINGKITGTYDIGGRLNVSGGQPSGSYTGTFTVDAHCQ